MRVLLQGNSGYWGSGIRDLDNFKLLRLVDTRVISTRTHLALEEYGE